METEKDTTQEETVYFEDLDLSDEVLDALYDMRFEKCTPVQEIGRASCRERV